MSDTDAIKSQIRAFSEAYDYDTGYQEDLLDMSTGAFESFMPAQGMACFRQSLPLEAHFVARVATMQGADCGPCGQLNVRMAVEAGVDRSLLDTLIHTPQQLPEDLRDVYQHALAVAAGDPVDLDRAERLRKTYGDAAFGELAVVITGSATFPTLKRALGKPGYCEKLHLDF